MIQPIPVVLFCAFVALAAAEDCNRTHFEFFSQYSLGKQDELNRTFDQLAPKLKIPNVSYKFTDLLSFNLTDITARLRYRDSRQKAEIVGRDTIFIYGGDLQVEVDFKWTKITMVANTNGTGSARATTDEIMFEKLLQLDEGYLDYQLVHAYPVSMLSSGFSLTRVDPPLQDESQKLGIIVNDDSNSSIKANILRELNGDFEALLKQNLKNEHYPLDDHFDYVWDDPRAMKKVNISYSFIPTGVDLHKQGLSLTYVSRIKDDPNWECGKAIPTSELNPDIYGGIQEFISFSVISNTVRYSFAKGYFNTELNRGNWESRFFQFFAGDLYEVIPAVAAKYYATEQVRGSCIFNQSHRVEVAKSSNTTFSVTTDHSCTLTLVNENVADFSLLLRLQIEIHPTAAYLNFVVKDASADVTFRRVAQYEVVNQGLAQLMIRESLLRLKEGNTFGSGWKIYPRDYPNVMVLDDLLFIYDSTHVSSLSSAEA